MTEAMPFLQKYDITFFRPPPIWRRDFFVKYIMAHFCAAKPCFRGADSRSRNFRAKIY